MPIKNLTDKPRAALPRLGQLRKGAKKTDPKKPGMDLTYFRFVCNDPAIAGQFAREYGQEPRLIHVHLPYPGLAESFPTWQEEYVAGGLKHRCDGETMVLWLGADGVYHTEPKPCPYAHLPKGDAGRKCKPSGILYVIVPELGRWGYVEVLTTSTWDCIELTNNLQAIEELAQRASLITGRAITMQGIPCLLKREPREISTPSGSDGKRARREKWLLHLEADPAYIQMLMQANRRYALPVADLPRLAAPAVEIELDYEPGDDDVEQPETEIVEETPAPAPLVPIPETGTGSGTGPAANGNGSTVPRDGSAPEGMPTKAPDFLSYVNQRVEAVYGDLKELRQVLAANGLAGDNWPAYSRDPAWWSEAYRIAMAVAEAKRQSPSSIGDQPQQESLL